LLRLVEQVRSVGAEEGKKMRGGENRLEGPHDQEASESEFRGQGSELRGLNILTKSRVGNRRGLDKKGGGSEDLPGVTLKAKKGRADSNLDGLE